jgi:hypothetical protein
MSSRAGLSSVLERALVATERMYRTLSVRSS